MYTHEKSSIRCVRITENLILQVVYYYKNCVGRSHILLQLIEYCYEFGLSVCG